MNDSPQRNAVTPAVRAAALRSTALATCLALAVAFSIPAAAAPKIPLPKPRPIVRHAVPATTAAIAPAAPKQSDKNTQKTAAAGPLQLARAPATAPLGPSSRPPAMTARKPVTPAAVAATSATSQADKDALENVIELLR